MRSPTRGEQSSWRCGHWGLSRLTYHGLKSNARGRLATGVHSLSVQSVYGSSQAVGDGFGVAPGIFLKGITPLRTITHKNFNLAGPTRGLVAGYFCHGDVRGDTARSNSRELAPHFPGCDAPRAGYSPYFQSRGPVGQFGFGSVTAMGILRWFGAKLLTARLVT